MALLKHEAKQSGYRNLSTGNKYMKYYENKSGYLLCTELPVDSSKLAGVKIINTLEEAENVFHENNGSSVEDGVFIPSVVEKNGQLYVQGLNTCFDEVDKPIEDCISQYSL